MDATDRERLSAWVDGELSPEETRALHARIQTDPVLRRETFLLLEEWRRTWDLLGRYPDEPVPAGFADAVFSKTTGASDAETAGGAGEGASPAAPLTLVRDGGWRRLAAAAGVVAALGVGSVLAALALAPPRGASGTDVLEAIPAEAVENLSALASFTDAEFEAILEGDPDELARLLEEAQGG